MSGPFLRAKVHDASTSQVLADMRLHKPPAQGGVFYTGWALLNLNADLNQPISTGLTGLGPTTLSSTPSGRELTQLWDLLSSYLTAAFRRRHKTNLQTRESSEQKGENNTDFLG